MPILDTHTRTLNLHPAHPLPGDIKNPFKIEASPDTDIWRRPPSTDVFTAPVFYQQLPDPSKFLSARVTFRLSEAFSVLYDQAGILVHFPQSRFWIKSGVELSDEAGTRNLSTVAAGKWADWGLVPLPAGASRVTIEIAREGDEGGVWVYYVQEDGTKVRMREVTWAFSGEGEAEGVQIGAYCCRPSGKLKNEILTAEFETFQVEIKE